MPHSFILCQGLPCRVPNAVNDDFLISHPIEDRVWIGNGNSAPHAGAVCFRAGIRMIEKKMDDVLNAPTDVVCALGISLLDIFKYPDQLLRRWFCEA